MVKKYKITKEQRIEIEDLHVIMNRPGKVRFDSEKKEALEKLVILHNNVFGTSYEKSNASCPGCVTRVTKNINKLVDSWQIDKK
tara:strand:+ start:17036 stop:17287 length:252 start_codon:yes stop_codon:yes gene_type:complete